MNNTDEILHYNRGEQIYRVETPVDPEGDAAFWRARAEKAEAENLELRRLARNMASSIHNEVTAEAFVEYSEWMVRHHSTLGEEK